MLLKISDFTNGVRGGVHIPFGRRWGLGNNHSISVVGDLRGSSGVKTQNWHQICVQLSKQQLSNQSLGTRTKHSKSVKLFHFSAC